MNNRTQPWGRIATFGLGFAALLAGQFAAITALTWWYGRSLGQLPNVGSDGTAVTGIILVSTPVEIALLMLWARRCGPDVAGYLGLIWPRRSEVVFGVLSVVALIVVANTVSWLLGRDLITPFQNDIYSSAGGSLLLLWFAVVVAAPAGEEILFRGFLFRGWLREPRDTWPVIVVTALLFALLHVQYDWFVISQVFLFGVLLGFMRWATGSTILTMLMHAIINFEGMVETWISLHG